MLLGSGSLSLKSDRAGVLALRAGFRKSFGKRGAGRSLRKLEEICMDHGHSSALCGDVLRIIGCLRCYDPKLKGRFTKQNASWQLWLG